MTQMTKIKAQQKNKPLTISEMEVNSKKRIAVITSEFKKGFAFIRNYPKSVTFFGSTRFKQNNPYYKKARQIAETLSRAGFAVVTGGGPGIMEAANRGAVDGDGKEHSIGLCIKLPREQTTNPYVMRGIEFEYFFSRKVILSFSAEAYIYFPGGFGTLDEFFEIITLIQTGKIEKVPIILVGNDYWKPLDAFFKKTLYKKNGTIHKDDMKLYTITEDQKEILKIVKNAPLRRE
ncbi:TIGR00730 family Rossman fold protein [Patescibacteria group bacterium]|nr:TIGR00730 family Rossman fold protein [Patescibacteria group bacterium]MBU1730568.1 TIGR00730 family Rossman fold protein [Patescibacteria group bacterium]MBU1956290.1 TIGR00730 family Rossman fold protein [Patescibacteria group bacterium]